MREIGMMDKREHWSCPYREPWTRGLSRLDFLLQQLNSTFPTHNWNHRTVDFTTNGGAFHRTKYWRLEANSIYHTPSTLILPTRMPRSSLSALVTLKMMNNAVLTLPRALLLLKNLSQRKLRTWLLNLSSVRQRVVLQWIER